MPRTFEERIAEEIDALYQGALFLEAGHRPAAEALVVETARRAFREHGSSHAEGSLGRWLQGWLVRAFLDTERPTAGGRDAAPVDTGALDHAHLQAVSRDRFFEAAGKVAATSRAAIWLVLLARWSYSDTAEMIGVEKEDLGELLDARTVLMQELAREIPGPGADGRVGHGLR